MRRAVAALNLEAGLPAGLCSKIGGKRAYVPQMCFSAEDCTGALPAAKPKRATSRNLTSAQTELFGEFGNASVAPAVNDGGGDTPHNPAVQPQPGGQDYPSELPRRLATSAQWPEGAAPLVWVDGNPMPERLPWAHTGIVGGDATSLAIAMASIWAKVTRDRIMDDLSSAFPHYGWAGNSGYGTPAHLTALREHGPSVHHRMTFLQKLGLGSDAC